MKRSIGIAISALTASASMVPHSVFAQSSVTLYGEIDTGIQYLTHANAAGKSQWSMTSAGRQPSLFGLLGAEDLGGGTQAIFRLEQGINSNDGSMLSPGTAFARSAYVGLTNDRMGTVTLGRQFSTLFDNTIVYDPTFFANYSLFSDYFIPFSNVWVNNAVKYRSPVFAGLSTELLYGFGEQRAGDSRAGRVMEAALQYALGGFSVSATYSQSNGGSDASTGATLSGEKDVRAALSARYKFGAVTVFGGYENISGALQLTPRGNTYFVGLSYQASPAWSFTGEAYRYEYNGSSAAAAGYVGSANYAFSKRTSIYLTAGFVNNRNGANFGLNPYTTTENGQSQFGANLGILHAF